MRKLHFIIILALATGFTNLSFAQRSATTDYHANNRFEQLGTGLPTPNTYRSASGAPGKDYWQQRADYDIKVELDEPNNKIIGSETITYFNQSPDALPYLWIQLDQNLFAKNSPGPISRTGDLGNQTSMASLATISDMHYSNADYGYNILSIKDTKTGKALPYTINQTMMRIDLPQPILSKQSYSFSIDWNYRIVEFSKGGRRTGFEAFKDGNNVYEIAQFYPRLCVYDDVTGWQNKQYYSQGEFALTFGNFKMAITVPNDHVLGATGELQNPAQVLTPSQLKNFEKAKTSDKVVVIESQQDREKAEKGKPTGKKTWIFKADNVRDVAFATSRKYIWDGKMQEVAGKKVLCMSFYPKEGNPLWGKYSTEVVAHTIKTYSKFSVDYPYPVAISCHGPVGGMEYPMICFNGGRPEADGTYSEATKYGMIGVIIHEVGHNFFPMIVNNDERQWMWMDEGLNTFVQYLTEKEWDRDYPTRRGEPQAIVDYMKQDPKNLVPIMTMSDNLINAGASAYAKPATALNILRETVMGRELFDYAFKEYSRRWAFKSPTPADFFRTMEDASGVDLDWFWKGWFYTTEPVDQDLVEVEWFAVDTQNPDLNKAEAKKQADEKRNTVARQRDKDYIKESVVEKNPDMKDFYNIYDPYKVTDTDKKKYEAYLASLSPDERKLVESGLNFYTLKVKNKGGLPMPVIVKMQFEDGTDSVARFPAEIWRLNDQQVSKVVTTKKKVVQWTLDPYREIADIDEESNHFPRQPAQPTRFQLFKGGGFQRGGGSNPMREAQQSQQAKPAQQGGANKN
ncbi:M1 family metallopeptidase [Runella sp. MFBS21]|uniref:M1 family metallopeptidase n=1 Tax=Runella sp. MFBS21 TaxID=3034018 RepID=UPI0023FA130D|nr:M1 family metallopeptidase [Runella sp. MFBS21]MDF7818861.1 M1 family metallopeptidase [Runella sp. MFBS21]